MRRKPNPEKIDDEILVFLYKNILLPWENKFHSEKFLMPKKGEGFKGFCIDNDIIIESPTSSPKLQKKLQTFVNESRKVNGLFRFTSYQRTILKKKETYTVPKCLLYHLRNSVAHASFGKKVYKGIDYLYFEGWYLGKLKIQAQIKEALVVDFIKSLVTTKVGVR